MNKFRVGEVVRTVKGSFPDGVGPIRHIIPSNKQLELLWGSREPHYLIRDNQSGEYIQVIERGIEKV